MALFAPAAAGTLRNTLGLASTCLVIGLDRCEFAFIPNVMVIREPMVVDGPLLVPFDPVTPTAELIAELEPSAEIAVGHWDIDSFGDDHNLIPTRLLAEMGIKRAFTGHVHKPDQYTRDGVDVVVVGSLQPFSHGEGDMYITLSLDEAREVDPAAIRDKCVRIQLQPGEIYDLELDSLQLTPTNGSG